MSFSIKDRQFILELVELENEKRLTVDYQIHGSTRYSVYKRLLLKGFLIQDKNNNYKVEDPFFLTD